MVFNSKLEIGQSNGNKGRHDNQDDENNEENTVDGVHLMAPHTGKNIVQLDINGTEWQEPSHSHLRNSRAIPRQRRDFSWKLRCPARGLKFSLTIFPSNPAQDQQRRGDNRPYQDDNQNGAEGESCGCIVKNSNCIQEHKCEEERPTK